MKINNSILSKSLNNFCVDRVAEFDTISEERQIQLKLLSTYLEEQYQAQNTPKAIIICTHNSRRSHLGQLWLMVGADFLGLPKLLTFSGGTEATAFNPRAVAALKRIGFNIQAPDDQVTNPKYQVKWTDEMLPYIAFSKKYDAAYENWMWTMDNCPDLSVNIYKLGIKIAAHKLKNASDSDKPAAIELVNRIYTQRLKHFPKNLAKVYSDWATFKASHGASNEDIFLSQSSHVVSYLEKRIFPFEETRYPFGVLELSESFKAELEFAFQGYNSLGLC